jgi:hypothetical protein
MAIHNSNRPEQSPTKTDEFGAARQTPATDHDQSWQELKGRITALRWELHETPVGLIGGRYWAERIRELEECQRKLAALTAPQTLRPP